MSYPICDTSDMKRNKPRTETAASGGSRVLLAARLATGAGKHSDKRRKPRGEAKRAAIQEHS